MLFKAGYAIFAARTKQFVRMDEKFDGAVAQLVEQRTENPCVPGSSPGGATEIIKKPSTKVGGFFSFLLKLLIQYTSRPLLIFHLH